MQIESVSISRVKEPVVDYKTELKALERAEQIGGVVHDVFTNDEAFREFFAYNTDPDIQYSQDTEDRTLPLDAERTVRIAEISKNAGFHHMPHDRGSVDSPRWTLYEQLFTYERWLQNTERMVQGKNVDAGCISW